jgi:hypothetical protein
MLKNKRLLLIPVAMVVLAVAVLGLRIGFPYHRLAGLALLGAGWIPLIISYRINRRLLRAHKKLVRRQLRPYLPHIVVALLLLWACYFAWVLVPVEKSLLAGIPPQQVRAEIQADLDSYLMLRKVTEDMLANFSQSGLLQRSVQDLSQAERNRLRSLWRDSIMVFHEFDLLKRKYRGFHQIDYVAHPQLHADAFLLAYMAYIVQYDAFLQLLGMLNGNPFVETLLNEGGDGFPSRALYRLRQRLTHPNVIVRINAGTAYYELVKKDFTLSLDLVADLEVRRRRFFKRMGRNADIVLENPLRILERMAFEAMYPVQKNVALQMSQIRTATRDYFITPEMLDAYRHLLQPGDILIQRRNWHMTNIGIPGFWPHAALFVGTPAQIDAFFGKPGFSPMDAIRAQYPDAFQALQNVDASGFPMSVIEAIRPGVVFQSLEESARCDYLGVIRPNLPRDKVFEVLLAAFSHAGKPYDLNFDFTTDNQLVCSELVYKAYKVAGELPFVPEIVNGRLLLSPNRMVEQAVANMGDGSAPFSFVLFLDAREKSGDVVARDIEAFKASHMRPKWDILQK